MLIHNYHPETAVYAGASLADPDPLEPGRWLIPACAVTEAPPETQSGEVAVWVEGSGWVVKTDHRGLIMYDDRTPVMVATVDAPEGLTLEPRPLSTEEVKAQLADYAASKRYAAMVAGVTINGVTIPGDDTSQQRIASAIDKITNGILSEPVQFVLGLASFPATKAALEAIDAALAQKTQAAFAVQGQAVDGINAGTITTTAQIDALAWPAQV